MDDEEEPAGEQVLRGRVVPWRLLLAIDAVVLGTISAVWLVNQLQQVLFLVVVSVFFAVVLNPAVDWLSRRGMRRGFAASLVFFLGVVIFFGLVYMFVRPAYDAGRRFVDDFPRFVEQARQGRGRVGSLVHRFHLDSYVQRNLPKLSTRLRTNAAPQAFTVARSVLTGLAGLVTVLVLTFMILLQAPELIQAFLNVLPPKRAERVRRVARDVSRSVTGYVIGNAATSIIAGVIVFITLHVEHVPFDFLLGLWVALVDLLPLVGGLLAGVPTVAIAFLHSTQAGVVTLAVFLIYQQIENHILNPVIMSRTVRLNALWVLLAVLVGAELAGVPGALLAIPIAGAIQVVARDLWDNRRGRPKAVPTVGDEERPVAPVAPAASEHGPAATPPPGEPGQDRGEPGEE